MASLFNLTNCLTLGPITMATIAEGRLIEPMSMLSIAKASQLLAEESQPLVEVASASSAEVTQPQDKEEAASAQVDEWPIIAEPEPVMVNDEPDKTEEATAVTEPPATEEKPAAVEEASNTFEDDPYPLEDIKATLVAAEDIDKTFRSSCIGMGLLPVPEMILTPQTDMISAAIGGKILAFSDEWFAEAANLLTPTAPIRQPGKMVYTGAWYDGWETRRHNSEPFDWVIVRLGVASGIVVGVEVDTTFFSGNHAPAISVEGCFSQDDDEIISWKGARGKWEAILGVQACGPSHRFGWKLNEPSSKQYTHIRLNMYPDGGIARFRLFGHAVPVFPDNEKEIFDLAAAQNGGVAISCSDQHFGTKDNLLLPGRGTDMGDGWETARSRTKGHVDWAVIKLGAPGHISKVIVDTAHFRGNFPQKVTVEAISWSAESEPTVTEEGWKTIVPPSKCGPDQEHAFECAVRDTPFSHVKLVIIPDGGVKRLRVLGTRKV